MQLKKREHETYTWKHITVYLFVLDRNIWNIMIVYLICFVFKTISDGVTF